MLRFGLFGAGRIGRVHAASLAAHPRTELAVVHDPAEAAAREVAAQYGALATGDAGAILGDPGIGAVIIASPTLTHVDLMTASVRAGKAVLCEKPIDLDLARVDACWAEIKDLGGTIMIGFNRRFDPSFAEVRTRVAAGEIGRLEQLVITSRDPAPPPTAYLAGSGGLFRDMTIHDFDMARFFLGEIVEVQAMAANLIEPYIAAAGDVDSAVVCMRGAGGALGQIINSRRCSFGYDQRIEAFGAQGMLSAGNQTATSVRRSGASGTETAPPYLNFFLDRYTPAYRAELDHLVTCIEQGLAPSPGFADGRAALALADAAEESRRTGRAVRVDAAFWQDSRHSLADRGDVGAVGEHQGMRSSSDRSRVVSTSCACSSALAGLAGPMVQPSWARCLRPRRPSWVPYGTSRSASTPCSRCSGVTAAAPRLWA